MDIATALHPYLVRSYRSGRIRHDRTFLEDENRVGSGDTISEVFHEQTKYTRPQDRRELASVTEFDEPELSYAGARLDPDYPGARAIDLPDPDLPGDVPVESVLQSRRSRRSFGREPFSDQTVGSILGAAGGASLSGRVSIDGVGASPVKTFRTYPSAGSLYPIELYPLVLRSEDLPRGVCYYNVRSHAIRVLDERDGPFHDQIADAFLGEAVDVTDASLVVVMTATFPRIRAKYGPRGYRLALLEAGHVAQNLQLVAEVLGLASVPVGGFVDGHLENLLGVDGVTEAAVYAMVVGSREGGHG